MAWDRINWLNPTIARDAAELPAGATICVHNGPTPADLGLEKEPGELQPGGWGRWAAHPSACAFAEPAGVSSSPGT